MKSSKGFLRFLGTDLETTGFSAEKGDRITEFSFTIYDFMLDTKTFVRRKTWCNLVNPERDIPAKVQEITSITPAMVATKPKLEHFAPTIAKLLASADCFVAHNLEFDGPFLHHEMTRLKQPFNMDSEPFCTMQSGRFAKPLGQVPKLVDLCWALDVPFNADEAHRASYDTEKMMEAFVKGCESGQFKPDCLKGILYE